MNEKSKINSRFPVCKRAGFFLLLIGLCVLAGSVSATTYTASDQNANGQYQIVYTVNPDNSQTFKAAGVAYGTMDVEDPSSGMSTGQDVSMSGQYGYALIAAQDSSGNQADAETWLYNGDACVHQVAGVIGTEQEPAGSSQDQFAETSFVPYTGAYAGQWVYSRNAAAIIADTDSQTADGLTADVNAQATGITNPDNFGAFTADVSGGYGCSVFRVFQFAGAFTPVVTASEAYSSVHSLPSVAVATQEGKIKGADTASVSTSSTTPNGLSTQVSASVNGGGDLSNSANSYGLPNPFGSGSYLNFDMDSVATIESGHYTSGFGPIDLGPEYNAESDAEITASGTSGTTNTFSSGPNGQNAGVNAIFAIDSCRPREIEIDLSAYSKLNDHVEVTKVENELSHLRNYEGTVTAFNSAGDSDTSIFDGNRNAGGVAGVVSDASDGEIWASWAHTWPNHHPI